jgi:hypothetical protein
MVGEEANKVAGITEVVPVEEEEETAPIPAARQTTTPSLQRNYLICTTQASHKQSPLRLLRRLS